MPVLSDKSIREKISAGGLVPGGDLSRAEHCSYEFTAGKLYFGGVNGDSLQSIDFEDKRDAAAVIKPGVLVWIRSRERVDMPVDCVGLWVQTNTLSRQGLLLLNMSLVEPGYEGPLTAAFVNFGRVAVPINSSTKIAKLMFLKLDGDAIKHVGSKDKHSYDASIEEIVARAPTTFLRVEDFLPDLGNAEREAVHRIDAAAAAAKTTNLAALQEQKEKTRQTISAEVEGDFKKFAWKMAGGFGVGFLLFVGLFSLVSSKWPWVVKNWDERADEATRRALDEESILTDIEALRNEMNRRKRADDFSDLAKRLEELEQRISELAKQNANAVPPTQD